MEKNVPHKHAHSHEGHSCTCSHDHGHGHILSSWQRWLLSLLMIVVLLKLLHPFVIGQMLVRVTSYSANASYQDAVRMCKKIIFLDKDNVQAWTALGYAYMDMSQT